VGILALFVAGRAIDDNDIRSGVVTDMTALTGSSLGLGGLYQVLPMLLEECGPRGGCWKLSPLFMPHCDTVIKQIHTFAIVDSHCHDIAKGIDRPIGMCVTRYRARAPHHEAEKANIIFSPTIA